MACPQRMIIIFILNSPVSTVEAVEFSLMLHRLIYGSEKVSFFSEDQTYA